MKLSIGMMVKNEEKYLEQCLGSLMPILDKVDSELIIVDTGSNDRTVEIAKKFTDKIYFHEWNNNFAEMRNITIAYCSGEWFFCIDGDEVLEDCNEIIKFFNSEEYKKYESAIVNVKNLMDLSDYTNYAVYTGLRLFKKDREFKYEGAIHNQPVFKEPTAKLNATIDHFGYITTDKELMEKKFLRTVELLKKELERNPEDFYYIYQLSVSYAMHGDKEKAVAEIEKCYCYIKENEIDISKHLYVLQQLCINYFNINNYLQVVKYAIEWLEYQNNVIDVYYFLGSSKLMLSNDEEAINYLERYIEIVENNHNGIVDIKTLNYTIGKIDEVYFNLGLLYGKINNNEKSIYYLQKVKSNKYNIIQEVSALCIRNKYYEGLYEYYNNLLEEKNNNISNLVLYIEAAKLQLDKGEYEKITELFAKGTSLYAKLNNIRISYENKEDNLIKNIKDLIDKEGMVSLPDYFGDLIFYLIDLKENISEILSDVNYKVLNNYLEYVSTKYDGFSDKVYEYLEVYGDKEDFKSLKINKELFRYVILLNKLNRDKFKYAFLKYIDIGIKYVNNVYTSFILENEKYQECRNEEDGFFIFMRVAKQYEKSDTKLYLRYLSKALEIYPNMKEGIELLLDEVKEGSNIQNNKMEEYKLQVKNTIKLLIDSGKIEDAEKVINEYEEIVKEDIEVHSFKAVIFMLQGRFVEAENILDSGLEKEPFDKDLLFNASYVLSNNNKSYKALEYFCKAKLFNPESNVNVRDIISNYEPASSGNLRIIHGTMEIANQMYTITKGLNNLGASTKTLNYYPSYLGYKSDYTLDIDSFKDAKEASKETKNLASKLLVENDVFHFHFGTSLTLDYSDLHLLDELGKKVFMHHWGSDIRLLSEALKMNPYVKVKNNNEDDIKKRLKFLSDNIEHCIVSDYELFEYVKKYYNKVYLIRQAIDLSQYKVIKKVSSKKMLIVHAPSSPEIKGTEHILKAVGKLKDRYNFDFKLVQGMSHADAKKIYQKADLIIDQLLCGTYGLFSVEAMAMGKPVICWIDDFMKDKYPKELPIISANPDTIVSVLESILKNRDMLSEIGYNGRLYVEKYHDMNIISKQVLDLYRTV